MSRLRLPLVVFVGLISTLSFAQSQALPEVSRPEATVTKLLPPVYPPLARQARITGDVRLLIHLRPDGTANSVEVISGHAMLKQAAIDSAEKSQFDCGGCHEAAFVYAFEIREGCKFGPHCTRLDSDEPVVTHSPGQVLVSSAPTCECDPAVTIKKTRSVKCLYLWKCGRTETPVD